VKEDLSCPIWSTVFVCEYNQLVSRISILSSLIHFLVGAVGSIMGAIPLFSSGAFLALTGSFIILTTVSYAIPFAANMASGRQYFPKGPFNLGQYGYVINGLAVIFIAFFDVMFCFREFAI
jgi:choline transport protein